MKCQLRRFSAITSKSMTSCQIFLVPNLCHLLYGVVLTYLQKRLTPQIVISYLSFYVFLLCHCGFDLAFSSHSHKNWCPNTVYCLYKIRQNRPIYDKLRYQVSPSNQRNCIITQELRKVSKKDFQSVALPTELPQHRLWCNHYQQFHKNKIFHSKVKPFLNPAVCS